MNVPVKVLIEMLKGAEYINAKSVYIFVSKYSYEDSTLSISFKDEYLNDIEYKYSNKDSTLEKIIKNCQVTHIEKD